MEKKPYSWQEFSRDIAILAGRLKDKKFDEIYGIPRAGLVIAVALSHQLGNLPVSLVFHPDRKVLVVDEICDHGKTLAKFVGVNSATATLFVNIEHSAIRPDFWVNETKQWIIFPWETEESSKYDLTQTGV